MKKYLPLALTGLLAGCQTDTAETGDPNLVSQEIFTTSVGNSKVYGVQIRATAEGQTTKGFAVQLSRNAAVWMDTVYLDLTAGDTLESELIFADAVAREDDNTELRIETFDIE